MHSGERDLFEPCGGDALNFTEERIDRGAARAPARDRDDAVSAGLRAPGLDAQRERRASRDAGLDRGATAPIAVAEALGRRQGRLTDTTKNLKQPWFVVVVNHADDAGKLADIVGAPRRITPRDDDARTRIGLATRRIVWRAP